MEVLEHEIATVGAVLARRIGRWLELVAEFDRRGGAAAAGFRSTSEWLAWRCGIGARAAREHVRVARRLSQLPRVHAALLEGELSYSQARALTRADESEDEAALLELAQTSTADQLERAVRALRTAASASPEAAARVHERRRVDWHWGLDGALNVRAVLPAEDGAAFVEAIETAAEALHAPGAADEHHARPPLPARRADALAELTWSGAPRTQVLLHVDPAALACTAQGEAPRLGEICALHHGPAVASETARRLSCDAAVEVLAGNGRSPDLGRSRRVVSPALRRSLERRDGGCRFPGCSRRHGLHAHHLTHWVHGGPTDRDNLVLLCRFHHRLVHEDGFEVGWHEGQVQFRRPDGELIGDLPPPVLAAA